MRFPSSFFEPLTRPLVNQIDQLCDTLHRLAQGLRESVVLAVGQAVADAVREALRAVLGAPAPPVDEPGDPSRSRSSLWWHDDLDRDDWYRHQDELRLHDEACAQRGAPPTEPAPPPRPWYPAWAAGLRVAARSFQCFGPYRIPVAIGAGLLAMFATLADIPVVAVGASVVGSLACLWALESDRHPGADARAVRLDR